MIEEKIYAAFDEVSQRNTRPRRLIAQRLNKLAACGEDFTTDDLWQELRQVEPKMGRATVFRAVEKLVDMGLLDRIEFADGTHRYRVCGGGLASLFGTWMAQHLNPFQQCLATLTLKSSLGQV
ncbi:MAG TPA: transcriptional repressor [Ktedonobacteraceae bacterium]|nr:transcriptional repressor [Ktedonobacteraceae bacterium]